jgi:HlyD family secretion protein
MATPALVERKTWLNVRGLSRRPLAIAAALVVVVVAVVLVRGAGHGGKKNEILTAPVEARNIALTIEATGTVEPIDLVEVKSKASGLIVHMPVEIGSQVQKGALLAQIDPRDVQNQYSQALAALKAAQAGVEVAVAAKKRSDALYGQQIITADEHEKATLDAANAQSQLVKARTDVDLAGQRRDDATVKAPVAGTILEQPVTEGTVITSATSSASGGTTLLKMADLGKVRMRAMVGETDIGNVRTGQAANVTVDAFPNRTFNGTVEKIEPQAVVDQSVTNFPVLISVSNESRVLLPGMNGEVSMLVDERDNVPAVPVDAVRSVRELPVVAQALGLDPAKVKSQVDAQMKDMATRRASRFAADSTGGSGALGGRGARSAGGDSARGSWRRAGAPGDSARGLRQGGRRGGWSGQGGGGGRGGAGGAGGGSGGGGFTSAGGGGGAGRANRAQVAFVKTTQGIEPRVVRLGLSDFDYVQVVEGVTLGEQVVLLGVAEAQATRAQTQQNLRQRMGSGVPGVPGGAGGGGGGGRAGGAGGGGGGAGRAGGGGAGGGRGGG